jgi:Activator of Hsp90 ATPase homolog 1-like protein
MNIDKFKPAIVYTIYIASTPEKVWQALTTAEFSRKYFSGFAVEAELKVGGAFVARAPDGSVHISGEVIECVPPRRLTGDRRGAGHQDGAATADAGGAEEDGDRDAVADVAANIPRRPRESGDPYFVTVVSEKEERPAACKT